MRKYALLSMYEQRLVQLGCSPAQARRSAWEIDDHFEDLKAGALEEGLSGAQAEARAAERLGDPRALAERLAATLRRNFLVGTPATRSSVSVLLPSAGIFLLLTIVPFVILLAVKGSMPASRWQELADGGAGYGTLAAFLQISFYGSLLALTALVCGLARRAAVGLKWTLTACALCALHAAFINIWVDPHSLFVGYLTQPNWICAAIPLLCATMVAARQWSAARSLAVTLLMAGSFPVPFRSRGRTSAAAPWLDRRRIQSGSALEPAGGVFSTARNAVRPRLSQIHPRLAKRGHKNHGPCNQYAAWALAYFARGGFDFRGQPSVRHASERFPAAD